ncbi:MAG: NAD-dependent epimerase/dehydratase family protein [Sandaracinaceae bacterium]
MSTDARSTPVAVGLVGAGYIADYHQAALRAQRNVEVKAVCDLSPSRAERFASAHGIPGAYTDLSAMLGAERLDVVHVLTPPQAHVGPARQVLEAGVDALLEKPLAHTVEGCRELRDAAERTGRALGTSFNFLFFDAYERLVDDLRSGRLGAIDQVDIVWNKELGQLKGGPYSAWMLQHPSNILFEVAPHAFAHAQHLVGDLSDVAVDVRDETELPRGLRFFRRWEIRGWKGSTSVRIRFSFLQGYPEHYVHVRGTNGTGRVDFENNTYVRQAHTPHLLDIDRFSNVTRAATSAFAQSAATLGGVVLAKAGVLKADGPFAASIARAVDRFYATRTGALDERLGGELAEGAIALAERVAQAADLPAPPGVKPVSAASADRPTTLVIGGTGFIGKALVRRLRQDGGGVRVLARDPMGCPPELRAQGVDVVGGDFTDPDAVARALEGIENVYHLARGTGKTWQEYLTWDVEPTKRLAEACLERNVRRFFYASSIAIYYAGKAGETIDERTQPVEAMLQANPYARSKAENERMLLDMHATRGLPLVIFRPGIVLGRGGNPYHWGVAAWPYHSVCRLYGDGNNPLPIVLVDDCADAMVKALHVEGIEGRSYNLVAEPSITANDYLDELEQRAGVKIERVPMPGWRSYLTAMAKYAVKAAGGDKAALVPSYADWQGRNFAAVLVADKAKAELGWAPVSDRETLVRVGIHEPVDEHFELEAPAASSRADGAGAAARA